MDGGLISVEWIFADMERGAFEYNCSMPRSGLFVNTKLNICEPIEEQIEADLGAAAE